MIDKLLAVPPADLLVYHVGIQGTLAASVTQIFSIETKIASACIERIIMKSMLIFFFSCIGHRRRRGTGKSLEGCHKGVDQKMAGQLLEKKDAAGSGYQWSDTEHQYHKEI